jgi:hypothetical protein
VSAGACRITGARSTPLTRHSGVQASGRRRAEGLEGVPQAPLLSEAGHGGGQRGPGPHPCGARPGETDFMSRQTLTPNGAFRVVIYITAFAN